MLQSPILFVELLTVGRRRRYFVVRAVYGLLMLLAMWVCYESTISRSSMTLRSAAQFAGTFFGTFSCIQLAAVIFLTPPMIAGTIASEHERRTIDYLLTTQLGDAEIALGKFAARMWAVFSQLITGLPILAIAMSMGGIEPRHLFESFLICLVTLTSIGSLSISISSRNTKARDAVTRTYMIVIAMMLMPALTMWTSAYLGYESRGTWLEPVFAWLTETCWFLTALNPFVFMFVEVIRPFAPIAPLGLPLFATIHGTAAALSCIWAVWSVRRFYVRSQGRGVRSVEPPRGPTAGAAVAGPAAAGMAAAGTIEGAQSPAATAGTVMSGLALPAEAGMSGGAAAASPVPATLGADGASPAPLPPGYERIAAGGGIRRRDLLDADKPMWWKERIAQKTLGRLGWGARIATVLFYGAAWFWLVVALVYSLDWERPHRGRWQSPIMYFASVGGPTIACVAMLLTASRAAGAITAEREQDTWISLISTPIDASEIVRAKMLGAAFSVRFWYLLIATAWFFCTLLHPTFVFAVPVMALVYALGLVFAATLGVYFSLRSSTSIKAMGSSLAVLVLGAGLGPCILAMLVQSHEPTAFSLPVVIAVPHFAAIAVVEEFRANSDFWGYVVLVFFATAGYSLATFVLYSTCVNGFDQLAGRSATRGLRGTLSGPRDAEQGGAGGDAVEGG